MLHPTAARTPARPLGASAAQVDFFDRHGPALLRAVRTLIGQPPQLPTQPGEIPRLPYPPPGGAPRPMTFAAAQSGDRPWAAMADKAQKSLDDAVDTLQSMEEGGATSQAELLAMQMKITRANQMFKMASNVMKAAHDARKAIIQNLRP
jgi:hypothetical protein